MQFRKWTKGERIVHATKPEWGHGEILQAESTNQDGKACQRLTVRFDRAGMKTVSTAFADLRPAGDLPLPPVAEATEPSLGIGRNGNGRHAPVEEPEQDEFMAALTNPIETMTRLPESVTDPFISTRKRVMAAIALYKFGETPSGLLDWAAVQTGLKDPLSRFNRHQLEEFFGRFKVVLDTQLRKLLKELRKLEPGAITELAASASPSGKQALRRADMDR